MTSPKPTDSEQLDRKLDNIVLGIKIGSLTTPHGIAEIMQLIQQRDQQRLSVALEALPKKIGPLIPGQHTVSDAFNDAIGQCIAALTAALGPDNI